MRQDILQALEYAFKKGFQVHPEAVEMLQEVEMERLDRIIKDIVREKTVDGDYHIDRDDLVKYLGLDEDEPMQDHCEILFDCTPKITTPQGVMGYGSLFYSRFQKMKRIMQDRPEFGKVRSIASLKASAKGDEELYVCGLVTEKRVDERASQLTLEDPYRLSGRIGHRGCKEGVRGALPGSVRDGQGGCQKRDGVYQRASARYTNPQGEPFRVRYFRRFSCQICTWAASIS